MKREINYDRLMENIDLMINTLEHDSQRSGGKFKQAVLELAAMHELRDRYVRKINETRKPGPKPKEASKQ